jgi:uncharacterized membrane protein (DUF441 family)
MNHRAKSSMSRQRLIKITSIDDCFENLDAKGLMIGFVITMID